MGKIPYVEHDACAQYGIMYAISEGQECSTLWYSTRTDRDIAYSRLECGLPVESPYSIFKKEAEWLMYPSIILKIDASDTKIRKPEVGEKDVKTIREAELSRMRLNGTISLR